MSSRGFVLIAMCATLFLLLAMIGIAFDFGRIYIARNEAQVFTDAAAMAAAQQLDGTPAGLTRARAAVARLPNRWNLGASNFSDVIVEFSADGDRFAPAATDARFARVTAPSNHLEIGFLRAVGGPETFAIPAHSTAQAGTVRLVE